LIYGDLRGAKAPLFHGAARIRIAGGGLHVAGAPIHGVPSRCADVFVRRHVEPMVFLIFNLQDRRFPGKEFASERG
jgi:hypothetical protein